MMMVYSGIELCTIDLFKCLFKNQVSAGNPCSLALRVFFQHNEALETMISMIKMFNVNLSDF